MAALTQLVSSVRKTLKEQAPLLAKPFGLDLLSKVHTAAYLLPSQIAFDPGARIPLPQTRNIADETSIIFQETEAAAAPAHVWHLDNTKGAMRQLRNGSVSIHGKVPDTDFGTSALFKDLLATRKRTRINADTLIAPWSHYWGGYYDYLLFVAAKLCRIKDALSEGAFAKAAVAYPLLNTPFEQELLALIGVRTDNLFDSRSSAVQFNACVLGNNDSWFYPNQADVLSIRKHVMAGVAAPTQSPKRIYISRSGRRRVLNENELIRMLERYDFTIVDDKPRTIAEQVTLYSNASFILGPHGASFANVLWCQPGTQLLELFAPGYVPEFFRYLAHLLGMRYAAYCNGPATHHYSQVNADMHVAIEPLERHIDQLVEVGQV